MHRSTIVSWPAGRLARTALVAAGLALAAAAAAPAAASAAPVPTLIWDRGGGPPLTSLDFSQPANGGGVGHTLRVLNTSQSASSALTITVTGSPAFTTQFDTCTGTSLSPGAFCLVFIEFSPPQPTTVGQTFSGTATARPASQDRPAVRLALTATITPP